MTPPTDPTARLRELLDDIEAFLKCVEWTGRSTEDDAGNLLYRIREEAAALYLGSAGPPTQERISISAACLKEGTTPPGGRAEPPVRTPEAAKVAESGAICECAAESNTGASARAVAPLDPEDR